MGVPCVPSLSWSWLSYLPPPTRTSNPLEKKAWEQGSAWVSMHQVLEMGAGDGMSRSSIAEALSDLGSSLPGQVRMCVSLKKPADGLTASQRVTAYSLRNPDLSFY